MNYFEYWIMDGGKVGYHNSWVTDIAISEEAVLFSLRSMALLALSEAKKAMPLSEAKNVAELVKGGRCRWKIENKVFNTLKNQGYHIEHNYGHGKKHLSMNFFLLNLLAFFMHQIFELTDNLYQQCRLKFGSKRNLWDHIRVSTHMLIFPDWETLLRRILRPLEFL